MWNKTYLPGVIYEVTAKCNLNCKYCYNYWKNGEQHNFIEDCEKSDAVATLKQYFRTVKTNNITFSGGEPTINFEELLDCVMYAKARNKKVTVITNGTLLDYEKIELLAKLKVDLVEITINSYNKQIHESINGVKDSFDRSVDAIKELLNKKIDVVVPIVVTKSNIKDIQETLMFIYNLGIKRIMINRYNIGGNGCKDYEDILPNFDELKEAFKKCDDFAKEKEIKLHSLVCTPQCVLNPAEYSNIVFSNCNCAEKNRYYTLCRNGDIRYCNHSPEVIGNIYEKNMKEILMSEKLEKWTLVEPEFCKKCSAKTKCWFGCRAASQQMGSCLESEDPIVKIYGVESL